MLQCAIFFGFWGDAPNTHTTAHHKPETSTISARQQESKMMCVLTIVTVLPLFTPLPHSCPPSLCKTSLFGVMKGSYHQRAKQIAVLGLLSTHPKKIGWWQGRCKYWISVWGGWGDVKHFSLRREILVFCFGGIGWV